MEFMPKYPDDYFDLAIVDPPYDDGNGGGTAQTRSLRLAPKAKDSEDGSTDTSGRRISGISRGGVPREVSARQCERTGGTWAAKYGKKIIAWDVAPGKEYFDELFRISRNQIIWGGNYFDLPPTRCFVVFRKTNIPDKGFSMAPVEYAWTSFNRNAEYIEAHTGGNSNYKRFHPTQKPVKLYKELLARFAKEGDKILDTHVGSGSSLIACEEMGYEYTGYEIDEHYYKQAKERLDTFNAQLRLF